MNDIQLLKKLISIPSYVDDSTNENEIADFLLSYLTENLPWLKVETQQVEANRYNIIARNSDNPDYVFISHMDTVLPSSRKQLEPVEKDGRVYGLGAGDMKSGLVASLKAVEEVGENSSVALIFDVDEEYYFKGVNKLIEEYSFSPKLAIFPEPSDELIVNGCRGILEIEFDVIGKTAHAGKTDQGVNAIEGAVKIIDRLKYVVNSTFSPEEGFNKTDINLASLNGGRQYGNDIVTQANAVPDIARILLDIRPANKNIDTDFIISSITTLGDELNLQVREVKINLDYQSYLTQKVELDKFVPVRGQNFKNDLSNGGFFEAAIVANAWNCPCISFGPSGTAHVSDESVDIKSFIKCKSKFKELLTS